MPGALHVKFQKNDTLFAETQPDIIERKWSIPNENQEFIREVDFDTYRAIMSTKDSDAKLYYCSNQS